MKHHVFDLLAVPIVLVVSAIWSLVSSATPTLSIEPPSQNVNVGEGFSLQVSVTNVADLFAYQFDIAFDPSVLAAQSITEGTFLSGGGSTFFVPGSIDNTAGLISFTANALFGPITGVDGGGVLAQMTFDAIGGGISSVNLSGITLLDSTLSDMSADVVAGSVQVQPGAVPEPGSFWIVALGIGWLGATRFRRAVKEKVSAHLSSASTQLQCCGSLLSY